MGDLSARPSLTLWTTAFHCTSSGEESLGGNAFVIYGNVSERLVQPSPAPRSIVDRLLGRAPMQEPAWSQVGPNMRMIDLPVLALEGIPRAFRDHVAARLRPPWTATATILDYLRIDVMSVNVRGAASGSNAPEWYVQLTFSGCAGMAEVSSELAAHWAERWYRAERADVVARFLKPYGFEPDGRTEPDRSSDIFVPLGTAGYALYNATPRPEDEEVVESRYFDIDASALESLSESDTARVLRRLDDEAPPRLANSCCCQLCAPDFDAADFEQFAPFR